jgi:lincosamide nucleotidyltransferase A/C/D/E
VEQRPEMTANDVVELLRLLQANGLDVCVDGGWGVDALLGRQTRPHSDLDIAIPHDQVPRLREVLRSRGYKDRPRDDTRDCSFVLADDTGRQLDVHSYIFDRDGRNVFGVAYPAESLRGAGSIEGYPVKTITPEWLVKFHSGYTLDANDYHDVRALCQKFDIDLPMAYRTFGESFTPSPSPPRGLQPSNGG